MRWSPHVRLDRPFRLTARPLHRLLHLILESHNGRALVPIPEVTTSRHTFRFIRSGSLAMLAAMRRGSSCL